MPVFTESAEEEPVPFVPEPLTPVFGDLAPEDPVPEDCVPEELVPEELVPPPLLDPEPLAWPLVPVWLPTPPAAPLELLLEPPPELPPVWLPMLPELLPPLPELLPPLLEPLPELPLVWLFVPPELLPLLELPPELLLPPELPPWLSADRNTKLSCRTRAGPAEAFGKGAAKTARAATTATERDCSSWRKPLMAGAPLNLACLLVSEAVDGRSSP
ncbi:MAG: hypothetical protein ACRC20_00730 [Segniliparus sp.]|uniref:hypothetical protein n=1 Tax=Segniliparus sp. TaxID=2804064 RepID=UPI003F301380